MIRENIIGKAFSMTELSLTSAGRFLLWLYLLSFIVMRECAWQHGQQDQKGAAGISQDTNLLQLPSCAGHKMILPMWHRNVCYFCEAFPIMTLLLFHPLNKELNKELGKGDVLIAVCMHKYSFWKLLFEILEIPKSRLGVFLGWLGLLFCFGFYS